MIVEEEIDAAVRSLRREFGNEVDEGMIELTIVGIRRHHREATIKAINGLLTKAGNVLFRVLTNPLGIAMRRLKQSR